MDVIPSWGRSASALRNLGAALVIGLVLLLAMLGAQTLKVVGAACSLTADAATPLSTCGVTVGPGWQHARNAIPTKVLSVMPHSPNVQVAWDVVQNYGFDPVYFLGEVKLLSNFDAALRSGSGRVGIAQLTLEQARELGLNVLDANSANPAVDERLNPLKALDALARLMTNEYAKYLGLDVKLAEPNFAAMAAIAAIDPKCGETCVDKVIYNAQAQSTQTNDINAWKYNWFFMLPMPVQLDIMAATSYSSHFVVPANPKMRFSSSAIIDLIKIIFGADAPAALRIANCESGYDAGAYNTTPVGGGHAMGIFQIVYPGTWKGTGYADYNPYDPLANIMAAHEIFTRDGNWHEWQCA